MEPQAKTGEAKPAVGEKLAQTHQLKLEKPNQLSERKVLRKTGAKTGDAKPAVGEKLAQTHQLKVEEPSQL